MEKDKAIKKVESFKDLGYNWNGYGAEPFSPTLIDKVKQLIEQMTPTPEVFPTAADSIQLEWEINGVYVELEVTEKEIKIYADNEDYVQLR